jgi:hypothetical protein
MPTVLTAGLTAASIRDAERGKLGMSNVAFCDRTV